MHQQQIIMHQSPPRKKFKMRSQIELETYDDNQPYFNINVTSVNQSDQPIKQQLCQLSRNYSWNIIDMNIQPVQLNDKSYQEYVSFYETMFSHNYSFQQVSQFAGFKISTLTIKLMRLILNQIALNFLNQISSVIVIKSSKYILDFMISSFQAYANGIIYGNVQSLILSFRIFEQLINNKQVFSGFRVKTTQSIDLYRQNMNLIFAIEKSFLKSNVIYTDKMHSICSRIYQRLNKMYRLSIGKDMAYFGLPNKTYLKTQRQYSCLWTSDLLILLNDMHSQVMQMNHIQFVKCPLIEIHHPVFTFGIQLLSLAIPIQQLSQLAFVYHNIIRIRTSKFSAILKHIASQYIQCSCIHNSDLKQTLRRQHIRKTLASLKKTGHVTPTGQYELTTQLHNAKFNVRNISLKNMLAMKGNNNSQQQLNNIKNLLTASKEFIQTQYHSTLAQIDRINGECSFSEDIYQDLVNSMFRKNQNFNQPNGIFNRRPQLAGYLQNNTLNQVKNAYRALGMYVGFVDDIDNNFCSLALKQTPFFFFNSMLNGIKNTSNYTQLKSFGTTNVLKSIKVNSYIIQSWNTTYNDFINDFQKTQRIGLSQQIQQIVDNEQKYLFGQVNDLFNQMKSSGKINCEKLIQQVMQVRIKQLQNMQNISESNLQYQIKQIIYRNIMQLNFSNSNQYQRSQTNIQKQVSALFSGKKIYDISKSLLIQLLDNISPFMNIDSIFNTLLVDQKQRKLVVLGLRSQQIFDDERKLIYYHQLLTHHCKLLQHQHKNMLILLKQINKKQIKQSSIRLGHLLLDNKEKFNHREEMMTDINEILQIMKTVHQYSGELEEEIFDNYEYFIFFSKRLENHIVNTQNLITNIQFLLKAQSNSNNQKQIGLFFNQMTQNKRKLDDVAKQVQVSAIRPMTQLTVQLGAHINNYVAFKIHKLRQVMELKSQINKSDIKINHLEEKLNVFFPEKQNTWQSEIKSNFQAKIASYIELIRMTPDKFEQLQQQLTDLLSYYTTKGTQSYKHYEKMCQNHKQNDISATLQFYTRHIQHAFEIRPIEITQTMKHFQQMIKYNKAYAQYGCKKQVDFHQVLTNLQNLYFLSLARQKNHQAYNQKEKRNIVQLNQNTQKMILSLHLTIIQQLKDKLLQKEMYINQHPTLKRLVNTFRDKSSLIKTQIQNYLRGKHIYFDFQQDKQNILKQIAMVQAYADELDQHSAEAFRLFIWYVKFLINQDQRSLIHETNMMITQRKQVCNFRDKKVSVINEMKIKKQCMKCIQISTQQLQNNMVNCVQNMGLNKQIRKIYKQAFSYALKGVGLLTNNQAYIKQNGKYVIQQGILNRSLMYIIKSIQYLQSKKNQLAPQTKQMIQKYNESLCINQIYTEKIGEIHRSSYEIKTLFKNTTQIIQSLQNAILSHGEKTIQQKEFIEQITTIANKLKLSGENVQDKMTKHNNMQQQIMNAKQKFISVLQQKNRQIIELKKQIDIMQIPQHYEIQTQQLQQKLKYLEHEKSALQQQFDREVHISEKYALANAQTIANKTKFIQQLQSEIFEIRKSIADDNTEQRRQKAMIDNLNKLIEQRELKISQLTQTAKQSIASKQVGDMEQQALNRQLRNSMQIIENLKSQLKIKNNNSENMLSQLYEDDIQQSINYISQANNKRVNDRKNKIDVAQKTLEYNKQRIENVQKIIDSTMLAITVQQKLKAELTYNTLVFQRQLELNDKYKTNRIYEQYRKDQTTNGELFWAIQGELDSLSQNMTRLVQEKQALGMECEQCQLDMTVQQMQDGGDSLALSVSYAIEKGNQTIFKIDQQIQGRKYQYQTIKSRLKQMQKLKMTLQQQLEECRQKSQSVMENLASLEFQEQQRKQRFIDHANNLRLKIHKQVQVATTAMTGDVQTIKQQVTNIQVDKWQKAEQLAKKMVKKYRVNTKNCFRQAFEKSIQLYNKQVQSKFDQLQKETYLNKLSETQQDRLTQVIIGIVQVGVSSFQSQSQAFTQCVEVQKKANEVIDGINSMKNQ